MYPQGNFLHPGVLTGGLNLVLLGVTTNSESGVISIDDFSAVFAEMERLDLVLNLHGELPSSTGNLSLEEAFLPTLRSIHERYPSLRIVLEHCSTKAALDAVRACGPSVAGSFPHHLLSKRGSCLIHSLATITAHHLYLTEDISHVDPLAFCKPIPKTAADRDALIKAVCSGDPKFFL